MNIAQKLGYITVIETLKLVTTITNITTTTTTTMEEKYRVQAPEAMQETFMSDSEEEGGKHTYVFKIQSCQIVTSTTWSLCFLLMLITFPEMVTSH